MGYLFFLSLFFNAFTDHPRTLVAETLRQDSCTKPYWHSMPGAYRKKVSVKHVLDGTVEINDDVDCQSLHLIMLCNQKGNAYTVLLGIMMIDTCLEQCIQWNANCLPKSRDFCDTVM